MKTHNGLEMDDTVLKQRESAMAGLKKGDEVRILGSWTGPALRFCGLTTMVMSPPSPGGWVFLATPKNVKPPYTGNEERMQAHVSWLEFAEQSKEEQQREADRHGVRKARDHQNHQMGSGY